MAIQHGNPIGKSYPEFDAVLATDGSCSGNPGPGGWAWVEQKSGAYNSGGAHHTTNNIMELTALLEGLRFIDPAARLLIRCDSQYVINTVTKWAPGWRKKGWRKADGKPVANQELVAALLEAYESRTGYTEVEWVRGHTGDAGNEFVDSLATAETRKHS
ncbi:ribonuclease H [Actinobaculum suis]|uniref:ribonuclease H family protein n=1 Tax=Actinobaculum suis TaxID=1657 RepID=UPI00066FC6F9|nr:ribonuclease H [Actinobaculum suis]KMY23188.1 ribonuclease H [Actinobaculum suis]